ncbi:hypothetical protein DPMN_077177 [Dreissena polymorpha]|uniref:Uncharacterized protein n=1 Tax=Dreissena polymorpha TaxID=45954 RepID=A0A9D3YK06_DREPO|nr:hypothetical protein DPMN_077177 [Dreissena polymorpha]
MTTRHWFSMHEQIAFEVRVHLYGQFYGGSITVRVHLHQCQIASVFTNHEILTDIFLNFSL